MSCCRMARISGSLNHTAASAAATLGPGVNTELIYIGAGSNPMASMAAGRPHVEARTSTPASLTSLISQIVARTCRNFRPDAGFSRSPSGNLVLGAPGFSMDFDGSPSSDTETPDSGLSFAWTLNGPSRSINLSGIAPTAPSTDADIGNWSVQLTVTDARNGNSHSASSSFTVDGQPPSITATGPGAIDALDTLALSAGPVNDPDGGSLTFDWDIIEAPAGAALQPPGPDDWTGPSAGFVTTETDITEVDGTAIGAWRFRVIATDNEGDTDDDEVTVVVRNLPPRIDLVVPATEIDVFETIEAETTVTMDDDGGALILDWDIVQVPDSAGRPVEDSVQTGASFLQPTSDTDAGTWILRLRAEDNEGEEVEEEVTILVDGPVSAAVTGPDEASLLAGITLSGEDFVDPDSPCPNISGGCHSTDGRAPVISAGIVEWRWSIADLPSEHVGDFSTGPVDEVLGIGGSGPTLNIPNGALRVGTWRFELYVRDAEGNEDTAFHSVEIIAPEGPPFAIAGGPQVHVLGFGGVLEGTVFVNGENSFDLDNLLIGDTFGPGMGITSYAWLPLIAPSGCAAATPFATPGGVIFGPGPAVVPPDCEGVYQYSLTVTDDDATPKTDTATQSIFITGCPDIVCIEDPTFEMPAEFAFSDQTDVEFLYKIDQTLYELAGCVLGCAAELSVFHEDDLLTPVFSATEFNPEPTSLGYSPVFKWNGFVRDPVADVLTRPEQGIYTTQIELVDLLTTPVAQDVEEQNISISVAEPEIDPATDRFVSFDALDAMPATDTVDIQYTVTGSAVPDQVRWRLRDQSSAVAFERAEPHTGTIQWNGKVTGSTIPAGLYSLELEILLAGEILGAVPPQDIAIYDMDFTLLSAQVPAPGPVANPDALIFVNSDDDNANGTADMDEAGSVAGEDDLGEYDISIVPAAVSASLRAGIEMWAPAGATLMRIYDTQTRATQFNFNDPVDLTASTLPAKVFVEGRQTGDATLELTLVDLDDATDIASITRDVAIHAVDIDTDTDLDGALVVTDDTTETDDMGMIVYVNNDDGGMGNDAVSNDVIDGATDRTELSELTIRRNAAIAAGSTLTLEVSDKTKIRIFDEMDTARIGPPAADGGPDAASYDIPIAGITAGDLAYLVEAVHGGEIDVTLTLRDAGSNVIGTDDIKLQNNVHREPGNTYSTIRNRITAGQALAGLIGLLRDR